MGMRLSRASRLAGRSRSLGRPFSARCLASRRGSLRTRASTRCRACLPRKGCMGGGRRPFPLQRPFGRTRSFSGGLGPSRCTVATRVGAGCTFPSSLRRRAFFRRLEIHARAARLRKTNGYGLLRGARSVFALADVLHFLTHELTGLSARRLSLPLIPAGPLDCSLLRHVNLQSPQTAT